VIRAKGLSESDKGAGADGGAPGGSNAPDEGATEQGGVRHEDRGCVRLAASYRPVEAQGTATLKVIKV